MTSRLLCHNSIRILYTCCKQFTTNAGAFLAPKDTHSNRTHRARQLYKNISMLFLFPVKDGKLSTGINATFNASCYD